MGTKIRRFSPLPRDLLLEDLVPSDQYLDFSEITGVN
jgi:hypothetical protein